MDRDEVMLKLGSIEAKLDAHIKLGERVSALEIWKGRINGATAILALLFTALLAAIKGNWFNGR